MQQRRYDALLKEYAEVANNFRTLTGIRFQLLSYLPLVSGATVALAVIKGEVACLGTLALSMFGLAVTIGLTTYNARNDQLYDGLISRAAAIERSIGLPDGYFANRPRSWLTIRLVRIPLNVDHRAAISIIYAASIALWLTLLFAAALELGWNAYLSLRLSRFTVSDGSIWINSIAFVLALALTAGATLRVKNQVKEQCDELAALAASAYKLALSLGVNAALTNCEFIRKCAQLADDRASKTGARASFYARINADSLSYYLPSGSPQEQASHLVALLTDLSPGWVFDCGEDRRG
jgi:hypothetical protein